MRCSKTSAWGHTHINKIEVKIMTISIAMPIVITNDGRDKSDDKDSYDRR